MPKMPAGVDGVKPGEKTAPGLPTPPALQLDLPKGPEASKRETDTINPHQARVIVHLPADAKLWVDQVACPIPGPTRSFDTPVLVPGGQYAYTLTVELPDGNRENRRVTMTAGRVIEVEFRGSLETVQK